MSFNYFAINYEDTDIVTLHSRRGGGAGLCPHDPIRFLYKLVTLSQKFFSEYAKFRLAHTTP